MEEAAGKKKFSTKKQDHSFWKFADLAEGPKKLGAFYKLKDFYVYREAIVKKGGHPVEFPKHMYMSENLFHRNWVLTAHRRLKNTCSILEFCPDPKLIKNLSNLELQRHDEGGVVKALAGGAAEVEERRVRLRRAFNILETSSTGHMRARDLREAVSLLDPTLHDDPVGLKQPYTAVPPTPVADKIAAVMEKMDSDGDGAIDEMEFVKMVEQGVYHRCESERYYVALSLEEAESVRGFMHAALAQGHNAPIIPGKPTSCALRFGPMNLFLDASHGYTAAPPLQHMSAEVCYRFVDSEVHFTPGGLVVLLRQIQRSLPERRAELYDEVRQCRRRLRVAWQLRPVSVAINVDDESSLLEFRALIGAVKFRLKERGLLPLDAFQLFDVDRDGTLGCGELWGGLEWLGMTTLTSEDIYSIVRHVDKSGQGRIKFPDFETAFRLSEGPGDDEDEDMERQRKKWAGEVVNIEPKQIEELFDDSRAPATNVQEFEGSELSSLSVCSKSIKNWELLWTTRGSKSRREASVWIPRHDQVLVKRNVYTVSLGHYAVTGLNSPPKTNAFTIQITDEHSTMFSKSRLLDDGHLNYLTPHPVQFKLAWSTQGAQLNLYVWRPVPPTKDFVALGMVVTNRAEPPPLYSVRCVNRGWVVPATAPPVLVWTDAGMGGRPGSLWRINKLGLMAATVGHQPPTSTFYDLAAPTLRAGEHFSIDIGATPMSSEAPAIDPEEAAAPRVTMADHVGETETTAAAASAPAEAPPAHESDPLGATESETAEGSTQQGGIAIQIVDSYF